MKTKKTLVFLTFLTLFIASNQNAWAKQELDTRYLIKAKAAIWKNSFGVRNTFETGFTADLSDWQLRLTKIFGLEIEPVRKLFVLPSSEIAKSSSKKESDRIIPNSQIPWGVASVIGSSVVEKISGGKDVTVAVLDTGVLRSHPDIVRRITDCKDFTSAKLSVVTGKCEDKNGHGTHVAGIIAADTGADGFGVLGVAPEVSVVAYKVCDANGSCWADDVASAIRTAADNGVQIITLSLGSDAESALVTQAVQYAVSKGSLVITAAGNDGPYVGSIDYPAAKAEVVAVGAIDPKGEIAEWSSRGSNTSSKKGIIEDKDIEFVAPGVNIESTWKDGGYAVLSGTSMGAPHVAGLAARLWDFKDEKAATTLRSLLQKLTRDIGDEGEDNSSGLGFPTLAQ